MAPGILIDQHETCDVSLYGDRSLHVDKQLAPGRGKEAPTRQTSDQPKIEWIPSLEAYQERSRRHLKAGELTRSLPVGFPQSVEYPMCWSNLNDGAPQDFLRPFSPDDIDEIERALEHFKALSLPKDAINPATFPLPNLSERMTKATLDVHSGTGCVIFRGLNPSRYSLEDNMIMYAGIASYIGESRAVQNAEGSVITHIRDVGSTVAPDEQRQSPYSNGAQPFHNDTCDVLCMYAIGRARTGGRTLLASAASVYNDLAASRPDLIGVLAASQWPFDQHKTPAEYKCRPILFHDDLTGRVNFLFSRRPLTGSALAPRLVHLPHLTEMQAEALDAVHFAAQKHSIALQLEKGDMQFTNNLGLFHAREPFTDDEGTAQRHLMRLWVRNDQLAWRTPKCLEDRWQAYYGGMVAPVWDLEHSRAHVIKRKTSCIG